MLVVKGRTLEREDFVCMVRCLLSVVHSWLKTVEAHEHSAAHPYGAHYAFFLCVSWRVPGVCLHRAWWVCSN